MENQLKIKFLIFIVVMHLVTIYLDLRRYWTNAASESYDSSVDLIQLYCKRTAGFKVNNTCDSTWSLLTFLAENCGLTAVNLNPAAEQESEQGTSANENIIDISEISQLKFPHASSSPDKEKPVRQEKNLVYHILFVLLVTSVTASIVDYFQEKSRRKALENYNNSSTPTSGSRNDAPLNRRFSLAELTMQRHARRESQAGYRPPGSPDKTLPAAATAHRNSSVVQDGVAGGGGGGSKSNQNPGAIDKYRQKSWPSALLRRWSRSDRVDSVNQPIIDGGWAERRRVRMIQRH